ncbi:MAG: sulfurtransferase TusA family protein [Syntrophomonadaceae bacterium]|nr:sulfurtransferase TusA family protein [Syntrophomonadaceae bacterium]
MDSIKADETLDVTTVQCPITFAKTLLKLEDMKVGQILEVFLNEGEPVQSVPRSVKNEGHKIIKVEQVAEKKYRLLIERGE